MQDQQNHRRILKMYAAFLALHNILRWVVIILAILALVRAYRGWLGKREWTSADRKSASFFSISMDIQLLLGLILYFLLSPLTRPVLEGQMGLVMGNIEMRFFGVEHIFYMILGVVFVHVGTILSRRADDPVAKHRRAAIWFTLAAIVLIVGIPWWRPLFPGLG
jgi:cytochrome c biogenesis factor